MTMAQVPGQAEASSLGRGQGSSAGQRWQVPIFVLGLLSLAAVAASAPFRQDDGYQQFHNQVSAFRQGLKQPPAQVEALQAQADSLLAQLGQFPQNAAEVHFLVGSFFYGMAREAPAPRQAETRTQAIHHLEQALALGVADADGPRLRFLLGQALFDSGGDNQRVVALLSEAGADGVEQPLALYQTLLQVFLRQTPPELEKALAANQKLLEILDDDEARAQAWLQRGNILVRQERQLEAIKALERIGPKAARQLRVQAQLLQARCCEKEGMWRRAAALWQGLLQDATLVPGGQASIYYSLGQCHHHAAPLDPAAAIAAWQKALEQGGEEGQAAGLRLGELHLAASPAEANQVLAAWTRALDQVAGPAEFRNRLVDLTQVRELFEKALNLYLEKQNWSATQTLAELYYKVAMPGVADEHLARMAQAQAEHLLTQASLSDSPEAAARLAEARTYFLQAAEAYKRAAQVRADAERTDPLWNSAQCFDRAEEPAQAAMVLEEFVQRETRELRLAEGWLRLAFAYRTLNRPDQARQAFYKCIEIPATPFAYRARYQLAQDEISQKNLSQAEAILKQNLPINGDVDAEAHEQSLYLLASLLLQNQNHDQASIYIKQALQQYPNNPKALTVRDQLGECFRKLAETTAKKMGTPDANAHYRRSWQRWAEKATEAYQDLADDLDNRARHGILNPAEQRLLTKSVFAVADLKLELGDYAEALRRYEHLLGKYRGRIEVLIACQRIWRCLGVMIDTPEQARQAREAAQAAVIAAQADLDKIPASDFQDLPGVSGRAEWQNWLRWAQAQLPPPARSQPPAIPKP